MTRLVTGGLIDRSRPLSFSFDGRRMQGFAGDTLASALIANDVRLVGRSFKYHRPRGIVAAGSEEPNALFTLRTGARLEPNTRATTAELYDGLVACSQNRWPSLKFDVLAINGLLSSLFVAGFYYKTFMWPAAFWEKVYEPLIRRAAGLGALSGLPDPDCYDRDHAFCDLLIVGGGPAGLSAALVAGRAGARVLLVEDDPYLGGRLLSERHVIDDAMATDWATNAAAELAALANVRVLTRTMLFGSYDGGMFGAVERVADHLVRPESGQPRQRLWRITAARTVLATGAVERPITFGGNDVPGVMMAGAVQSYVNRYAAVLGRRVAVFTNNASGHRVAADLRRAGVDVTAVIDPRETVPDGAIRGVVLGTRGRMLRGIDVREPSGATRRIKADVLAVAGGWNPAFGIASHLGARPIWSNERHTFLLDSPPAGMRLAGAAAGHFTLAEALVDGQRAAAEALNALGRPEPMLGSYSTGEEHADVSAPLHIFGGRQKAFVDLQHDVTVADIALAEREGFRSVEHLKRYTTLGMATDQGKMGQVNGHALIARFAGRPMEELGTVLSRPPYQPVAIGVLAGIHRGEHFRPTRLTAAHGWAKAEGAVFTDAGQWKRPQYFPQSSEHNWLESVTREARAVRSAVGFCDVSTLGKIELGGADVAGLLDRVYANMMSTLPIGRARYGLMLREDGFVLDDGTVARLSERRYVLTTTTANAARVMQQIDFCRQVLWPELDVQAVSVTEQWAQYAVAGPNARALLTRILPDLDLTNVAFPFMAATACRWQGGPARLFRISFSGELAYEIAVPADRGAALARMLMVEGRTLDLTPYGTEALGVLRIEKGHAAGNELNGTTTAHDLGLGRMLSMKKDFVGRTMALRTALTDPARPQLVGLRPTDPAERLRCGAHLITCGSLAVTANDQGHVTSTCFSPVLGQWIGLGMLARGPERHGERVRAVSPLRGSEVEVEVVDPVFVDREGSRLRG